jgi:uncharacterized protein (TIRG00374 family)
MATDEPRAHRRPTSWVRLLNLGFLLLGIAALIWLIRDVGLRALWDRLIAVRGWAAPILAMSFAEAALKARALHIFMRPEQGMVSYQRVLAAQLSGQAINAVTPTGGTAGEVVKATMLMGHAPRYRAVSSVVTYNLVSMLISAGFLLLAIVLALAYGDLSPELERGLQLTFLVVAGTGILFAWLVHRGLVRTAVQLLRGVGAISRARKDRIVDRLRAFDDQMRLFRSGHDRGHGPGYLYALAARIVGWADLWVIMVALGEPRGLVFTIIAAAAGMILGTLASVVPLGIGVAEGGQAGIFELMGAGAALGLTIGLIRRVRSIAFAAIGLLLMAAVQLYDQLVLARARAHIVDRASS